MTFLFSKPVVLVLLARLVCSVDTKVLSQPDIRHSPLASWRSLVAQSDARSDHGVENQQVVGGVVQEDDPVRQRVQQEMDVVPEAIRTQACIPQLESEALRDGFIYYSLYFW